MGGGISGTYTNEVEKVKIRQPSRVGLYVVHDIIDGYNLGCFLIGDLDLEFFLQTHKQLDHPEGVGAEIGACTQTTSDSGLWLYDLLWNLELF